MPIRILVCLSLFAGVLSAQANGSQPLSRQGADNLVAFARLYGVVRYFHPADTAVAADWDALAVAGAASVEPLSDALALTQQLVRLFHDVAPAVTIATAPIGGPTAATVTNELKAWSHTGFRGTNTSGVYRHERMSSPAVAPWRAELIPGVWAEVPLAVPAGSSVPSPTPHQPRSARERAVRLASVIVGWNAIQHFYPNFSDTHADWPGELRTALNNAAVAADESGLERALRRMTAPLDDGHVAVAHSSIATRMFSPPMTLRWADNSVLVAASDIESLQVGDVVTAVDRVPIDAMLREIEALLSAGTPEYRRHLALQLLLRGAAGTSLTLEVARAGGGAGTLTLTRSTLAHVPVYERRLDEVAEPGNGILYVDLTRITTERFLAELTRLQEARGLIFDLRGYPRRVSVLEVLPRLAQVPLESPPFLVPLVTRPDRADMSFRKEGWKLDPKSPYLKAPKVFLSDVRGISQTETWLALIERHHLGTIVGTTSAGTNGDVTGLLLPGGVQLRWTGLRVLKHDGSRHNGVGIAPVIVATPTRAGLAAGRDEVLERAIAALSL